MKLDNYSELFIKIILYLYQMGSEHTFQEIISKIRKILNIMNCSGEQVKSHYAPPNFPTFTPIFRGCSWENLISSNLICSISMA